MDEGECELVGRGEVLCRERRDVKGDFTSIGCSDLHTGKLQVYEGNEGQASALPLMQQERFTDFSFEIVLQRHYVSVRKKLTEASDSKGGVYIAHTGLVQTSARLGARARTETITPSDFEISFGQHVRPAALPFPDFSLPSLMWEEIPKPTRFDHRIDCDSGDSVLDRRHHLQPNRRNEAVRFQTVR